MWWMMLAIGLHSTPAFSKTSKKPVIESPHGRWELMHAGKEFSVYVDESSRRVTHDGLMVWKLWEYKIPKEVDGRPFKSEKVQTEYDCKHRMLRELMWVAYGEAFGKGEVVSADPQIQEWKAPESESVSEMEWLHFCK